jgi:hypothetical protein
MRAYTDETYYINDYLKGGSRSSQLASFFTHVLPARSLTGIHSTA